MKERQKRPMDFFKINKSKENKIAKLIKILKHFLR